MRNFQDTFETRKRSFISAFSICMTALLSRFQDNQKNQDKKCKYIKNEKCFQHKIKSIFHHF